MSYELKMQRCVIEASLAAANSKTFFSKLIYVN